MKPFLLILLWSLGLLASSCGEPGISCDDLSCDDGDPCTEDFCNPDTVACESVPASDGTSCEIDGGLGACEAGICTENTCDDPSRCGFPEMGRVEISLTLEMVVPAEVLLEADCSGWIITARFFFQGDGTWRLIGPLPAGTCTGRFVANDASGETLCTDDVTFEVEASSPTQIDRTIVCGG